MTTSTNNEPKNPDEVNEQIIQRQLNKADAPVGDAEGFEKAIAGVMDGLMKSMQDSRRKSPEYLSLAQKNNISDVVNEARYKMRSLAITTAHILREKFNLEITNSRYQTLLGLALFGHLIREEIEKTQGYTMCEDKTCHVIARMFTTDDPPADVEGSSSGT